MKCPAHPQYKGIRKPGYDCELCNDIRNDRIKRRQNSARMRRHGFF